MKLRLSETEDSNGCSIIAYGNSDFNNWSIKNVNIVNTYANTEIRIVAEVSALATYTKDNIRYVYKDITSKNNRIILRLCFNLIY